MSGRSRGFTLIEILVAVVIIGIVMSVAILSLSLVGDDRELKREAQRLVSLMQLAQDDAMMQGREFGVEFTTNAYRFVEYEPVSGHWAEPPFDDSLKTWQLPDDYEIYLFMEDRQIPLDPEPRTIAYDEEIDPAVGSYTPHVLIFSSSDVTPFELHIRRRQDDLRIAIQADLLGNFEFIADEDIDP